MRCYVRTSKYRLKKAELLEDVSPCVLNEYHSYYCIKLKGYRYRNIYSIFDCTDIFKTKKDAKINKHI